MESIVSVRDDTHLTNEIGQTTEPRVTYPGDWSLPEPTRQIERLEAKFPGLEIGQEVQPQPVPEGFDGTGMFPKLSSLGRLFGIPDPYGLGYNDLILNLIGLIRQNRLLVNHLECLLSPSFIRVEQEVRLRLESVESGTPNDCLSLPISFGRLYSGWSPIEARESALKNNLAPLCTAQALCLLAVMPERLNAKEHLQIALAGDEYRPGGYGPWTGTVICGFSDLGLELLSRNSGTGDDMTGSPVVCL